MSARPTDSPGKTPSGLPQRAAAGWLAHLRMENPFFAREARALSRHFPGFLGWPLALQSAALLGVLAVTEGFPRHVRIASVAFMGLLHMIACACAGWRLGQRLLADEHRQRTLDDLRLIPIAAPRWLLLKLFFPLYGLAIPWVAALPFYWAGAARGDFLPGQFRFALSLAAAAGLAAAAAAVLAAGGPEESRERASQPFLSRPYQETVQRACGGLAWWLFLPLYLRWITWSASLFYGGGAPSVPFFSARLPADLALGILLGSVCAAAWATALAQADPFRWSSTRVGHVTRLAALWVCTALLAGCLWATRLRWIVAIPLFWVVPLPLLLRMRSWLRSRSVRGRSAAAQPQESPANLGETAAGAQRRRGAAAQPRRSPAGAREVAWLERRWGNPVFVRDLRVLVRSAGMKEQMLRTALGLLVFVLLWAFRIGTRTGGLFGPQMIDALAETAIAVGVIASPGTLLGMGVLAARRWTEEWKRGTLTLLFASPLSSAEIVLGRLAASALGTTVQIVPAVAIALVGLRARPMWDATLVLGIASWVTSLGLLLAVGYAGSVRPVQRFRDLVRVPSVATYAVLAQAVALPVVIARSWGIGVETAVTLYTLTMTPVCLGFSLWLFRRAAREVDAFRWGDWT